MVSVMIFFSENNKNKNKSWEIRKSIDYDHGE